jgi:hypothetical protein
MTEQLDGEELARRKDEAIRQAFMWRWFYDDCGRSYPRTVDPGCRGPRVDMAGSGVGVKEAA